MFFLALLGAAAAHNVWAQPAPNPSQPPPAAPADAPPGPKQLPQTPAQPESSPDQGVSPNQVPPAESTPEEALNFPERTETPELGHPTGEAGLQGQPTQQGGQHPQGESPEAGLGEPESFGAGDPASVVREEFPALAGEVQVDVSPEGVIELTGDVPLLSDKLALGEAVSRNPGSGLIVNRLAVNAPRRSDRAITREVRSRLRQDEFLRDLDISVQTREQRVYLRGEVPSFIAVQEALRQAAEVKGVRDVIVSELELPIPR